METQLCTCGSIHSSLSSILLNSSLILFTIPSTSPLLAKGKYFYTRAQSEQRRGEALPLLSLAVGEMSSCSVA
jgi:hypothetical protein